VIDNAALSLEVARFCSRDEARQRARDLMQRFGLQGFEEPGRQAVVQPSKGGHVVVPRERLPLLDASVLLPSKQGDGRSMFAIPWGRQTIPGTTDTPYDGALDGLSLTQDDLDYVLAAGNAVFKRGLTEDDVLGAWAGVRPLIRQPGSGSMSCDRPARRSKSR